MEGLEELQLRRQRAANNPNYDTDSDADDPDSEDEVEIIVSAEEKVPKIRRKSRGVLRVTDDSLEEIWDPVDETQG